jgi:hypothetical protein
MGLKIFIGAITKEGTTYHLSIKEELCKIIFECYFNIEELDK